MSGSSNNPGGNSANSNNPGGNSAIFSSTASTGYQIQQEIQINGCCKADNRAVICLRSIVVLSLIIATSVVATLAYYYSRKFEHSLFLLEYEDSAALLKEGFQRGVDIKVATSESLSKLFTYRFEKENVWPNVTLEGFVDLAAGQILLSRSRAISYNPIIVPSNRNQWEAYARDELKKQGLSSIITPQFIYMKNGSSSVSDTMSLTSAQSAYPENMVPVWQITPLETNTKAIFFNLHSEPSRRLALDDMVANKIPALTAILQLVQDNVTRPSSILFYPVFNSSNSSLPRSVIGSISVVFSWDDVLAQTLPTYIAGMVCVLRAQGQRTNQTHSYVLAGGKVNYLGAGDQHDSAFDSLGYTVNASLRGSNIDAGVGNSLIQYSMSVYPSAEMRSQYETDKPAIYTAVVVLIFFFTSAMFFMYDYLVQHRQATLTAAADHAGKIVDSLFPSIVRARLFGTTTVTTTASAQREMESPAVRLKRFFRSSSQVTEKRDSVTGPSPFQFSAPIADVFQSTTILFADIAGFTAWSSTHPPEHVFRLLESMYREFDLCAKERGVFKVETIGDCYMAVCGLPDPREDHAVAMSQFALDMQIKMEGVTQALAPELGADVLNLKLRSGMHSGPVTAGVLRGEKSRFQLFGDTVNTASRMESTGAPSRIQVSEQTANLLIQAGVSHWLTPRDTKVQAKGKGELQTFWLTAPSVPPHAQVTVLGSTPEQARSI
uniref:Guanylate cyclase domain-containing protein n=2 Tax=Guillardia theta TaxID=55529 RepID=A0A7S4P6U7_GUITH|mmetsp:Transcript_44175/g.139370  ORF Transcript_44175/g.139370 Transcript_44175/m.139370 type:complete len:719 (+) Transcript_44175:232-2388(+)